MKSIQRRLFLKTSAAVGVAGVGPGRLSALAHASAGDVRIDPDLVQFGPDMDPLVTLIRETPRDKCVPVFVEQLRRGLSYQRLLAALFLTGTQTGDLHHLAQIYAAHRISSTARIEDRLLPLFWALDRIKANHESPADAWYALSPLKGALPAPGKAEAMFLAGMWDADPQQAELAVVALARSEGPQQTMARLWAFAARNLPGYLGHMPIGVANATRTLNAVGWQYAEPALRYLTTEIGQSGGDSTYGPNTERVQKTLPQLPADWAGRGGNRAMTLELYNLLRTGKTVQSCDLICSALIRGQAQAGAVWDAVSLAAADLLFRYSIGGNAIGGVLVHAVTSTNALRFGFEMIREPELRLLNLLQAAGFISDSWVSQAGRDGRLRQMNLVEDLDSAATDSGSTFGDVFDLLPRKADAYEQQHADERLASDHACQMAFSLLGSPGSEQAFLQAARSLLCVKASEDPHDFKYAAAVFEDARLVSPEWRRYLLASSVHALHGSRSPDTGVLVQARDALL